MLSKNQIQFIRSLHQKKFRSVHHKFIAEGPLLVQEALNSTFEIAEIYATEAGLQHLEKLNMSKAKPVEVSEEELKKISLLQQPNQMLAVVEMKQDESPTINTRSLTLALDHIADPGNMGTIIRLADWFGIDTILCSSDCVEVYNPKVVQATMGSVFRIRIYYSDLKKELIKLKSSEVKIYGALLEGEDIYESKLPGAAVIVMGNESRGISEEIKELIDHPITIPSFNSKIEKAESLNVAIATAIVCSEFRRRTQRM